MSIRRRKKTKAFTQIDNAALRNPGLSLKAKGLLAVMMSCPEDWQFYMDWLQQQSSDGRESHQTAMKELEALGYVVREKVQGKGGKFSGWEYLVDDEPLAAQVGVDSPTNGKAVSRLPTDERENRQSGKPSDGKPAASNNELKNNDLNKEKTSSSEDFNARAIPGADDGKAAGAGTAVVARPGPAMGGEATAPSEQGKTQDTGTRLASATSTENVPPAAAPGGSAILALVPIPRAELEARPRLDPVRNVRLRALLQLSHKSKEPVLRIELAKQTPGRIPQDLLTHLTTEELDAATAAAQADQGLAGTFASAARFALHRLIGEPLTLALLKGEVATKGEQALGRAYDVKNEGLAASPQESPAVAEGRLRPGAMWRHKKTLEVVLIRSLDGTEYVLSNGQQVSMLALNRQYEFEAAPSEASA